MHFLAIPSGRTSVDALGGELSLWNPLLVAGAVEHGLLDIAVLYAPGFCPARIDFIVEEQLVQVRRNGTE